MALIRQKSTISFRAGGGNMANESSEHIKYYEKSLDVILYIVAGAVFIVTGFVNMGLTRSHFYIYQWVIGGLMFAMAAWYKKNPIVVFEDDGIVIHPAPARSKRKIYFSDIQRIDEKSENKVYLVVEERGFSDSVKLPLRAIAKENRGDLVARIKEHWDIKAA
jgi:hypothetical protein